MPLLNNDLVIPDLNCTDFRDPITGIVLIPKLMFLLYPELTFLQGREFLRPSSESERRTTTPRLQGEPAVAQNYSSQSGDPRYDRK